MRTILRAILAVALLLGSGIADWAPLTAEEAGHASCCCGMAPGAEDACPCPKPEGNRGPAPSTCARGPVAVVALAASRCKQGQRRVEARPEPASWARAQEGVASDVWMTVGSGRDPDVGRHLAMLGMLRI